MRFVAKKRRRPPAVIIVSLIDVLLVVLIFLMVSTTAKKQEPALQVNLPKSSEAKPGANETKPFLILVTTNFPFFFIGDRAVTIDNLQKELTAAVRKDPQLKVAVRADKKAPWGEVVKVWDVSKAAQLTTPLSFVMERTEKQ